MGWWCLSLLRQDSPLQFLRTLKRVSLCPLLSGTVSEPLALSPRISRHASKAQDHRGTSAPSLHLDSSLAWRAEGKKATGLRG